MIAIAVILAIACGYLVYRIVKQEREHAMEMLIAEQTSNTQWATLRRTKTPLETDNEVWQIEVAPDGYYLSIYKDKMPYECFEPMNGHEIMLNLTERTAVK